ncbi:MAG: preprotein translocase subunit YajC [Rickettsiales bacterium]|nr:preprotein translocase subunit YajC [Rickettsiales bacterium]
MLNQIFVSDAFAQASDVAAAAPETSYTSFIPLVLIFAIFYFLIVRPQSKKMKEHQELVNNLKTGNKVITSGGIVGVVTDVLAKENQVEVEIAEGVRVKILKNFVSDLVNPEQKKIAEVKKKK